MIIAYIPIRLKSTRLPQKGIKDIYGISAIERCIINAKAIPGCDKIIIATSTNSEDDVLETKNLNGEIEVVRGSEDDVLERFLPSIKKYNPSHIIRITGDCPLVSPELANILIKSHNATGADATFTLSKVALGISCEIYKKSAVIKLRELFPKTLNSEYLIYYFLNNPTHFKLNIVESKPKFIKPWRLTLDEENDLELLNMIYKELQVGYRPVYFKEVINFFEKFPKANKININNQVKYRDNLELINYLKKATTYNSYKDN